MQDNEVLPPLPSSPMHHTDARAEATRRHATNARQAPVMHGMGVSMSTEALGEGEKAATRVVIVGAGVGGLATAARLSKTGCRWAQHTTYLTDRV